MLPAAACAVAYSADGELIGLVPRALCPATPCSLLSRWRADRVSGTYSLIHPRTHTLTHARTHARTHALGCGLLPTNLLT